MTLPSPLKTILSAAFRERPVDELDKVFSRLMLGSRVSKTLGDGERRAKERLREHRKTWQHLPLEHADTRQRRRREIILRERQVITVAKAEAAKMKKPPMGGSAVIRSLGDIERVLGYS